METIGKIGDLGWSGSAEKSRRLGFQGFVSGLQSLPAPSGVLLFSDFPVQNAFVPRQAFSYSPRRFFTFQGLGVYFSVNSGRIMLCSCAGALEREIQLSLNECGSYIGL